MARMAWTVRGRLRVRHQIAELRQTYGQISPLAGVQVRVQARERIAGVWGSWRKWDDIVIGDDGVFETTKRRSDNRRRFRVQVRFSGPDLVVYGANRDLLRQTFRGLRMRALRSLGAEIVLDQLLQHFSRIPYEADWHTVHVDRMRNGRPAGEIDLGDLTFRANAMDALGDRIARRQAELWFLYGRVIALFEDFGPDYGFRKKVAVKYPHNNPLLGDRIEASYANPENYLIYIVENSVFDDYRIDYLLHELMHIWAYRHSGREKGMAWQLIVHGDTHGLQNRTWVAFHEGFAEWAYHQVYRRMFGRNPTIAPASTVEIEPLPFSRSHLQNSYGLSSLDEVERHDWGWVSILNLLTTPRITRYTFNGTARHVRVARFRPGPPMVCEDPALSFAEVLRLFITDNAAGTARQLRRSEMTLSGILDRAGAVFPRFGDTARAAALSLLDPAATTQPRDLLCRPRR